MDKFCDACAIPIPPYHSVCYSCPPPVINLHGAIPTLGLFSQMVVALETHGSVLIKGSAIADNPGRNLLYMGASLANAGMPDPQPKQDEPTLEKCNACGKGVGGVCGACHCTRAIAKESYEKYPRRMVTPAQ